VTRVSAAAIVVAAAIALAPAAPAHACAGCRNPNLPITRLQNVQLAPGEVRASAVLGSTYVHVVHPAGCPDINNCDEVPRQVEFRHDQRIYPGELRAVAEMGLTPSLGAELQVPFRVVGTTIRYTTPDGAPYEPADPGVHHRNETLAGVGDPWLLGRWATLAAGALVSLRAGTTLPLGRTQPNPFALGDRGLPHQHIQFGNGTFDPVAAADVSRLFSGVQVVAYSVVQASLYQNRHGFRAGNRFFGGLQGGHRLFGRLTGALGGEVLYEGPERWDGAIRQDGNLGRTELLASASLFQVFGDTSLGVTARVPLVRRIVAGSEAQGTLSSPVMLSVIVSRSFGR
jgi:hypothetical protein